MSTMYLGTGPIATSNEVHVHQIAPTGEHFSVAPVFWTPFNPAATGWEFWEVELPQPHGPGWTYEIQTLDRESMVVTVITVPEPALIVMMVAGLLAIAALAWLRGLK